MKRKEIENFTQLLQDAANKEDLDLRNKRVDSISLSALHFYLSTQTQLRSIDMSDNSIGCEVFKVLVPALFSHPSLTSINLDNNSFISDRSFFESIAECISRNSVLESISMSDNHISRDCRNVLQNCTSANPNFHIDFCNKHYLTNSNFTSVKLKLDTLNDKDVVSIFNSLKTKTYIHNILIEDREDRTSDVYKSLVSFKHLRSLTLEENTKPLAIKNMSENIFYLTKLEICSYIDRKCGCWLSSILTSQKPLRIFQFSTGNISKEALEIISSALSVNTVLKKLIVDGNNNSPASLLQSLLTSLRENTSLTHLSLHSNNILDSQTLHISSILKLNTNLKYLFLDRNKIGSYGVSKICKCLKKNTTLTCLSLSSNMIDNDGAYEISSLLKKNTTISEIYLEANRFREEGLLQITESLKDKKNFSAISFKNEIIITSYIAHNLISFLGQSTNLKKLSLSFSYINQEYEKIMNVLKDHKNLKSLELYIYEKSYNISAITSLIENNTVLTSLSIQGQLVTSTPFGFNAPIELEECILRNTTLTSLNMQTGESVRKHIAANKDTKLITKWPHTHHKLEYDKRLLIEEVVLVLNCYSVPKVLQAILVNIAFNTYKPLNTEADLY